MGMTDNNRRVRTKAYSVAVLAVELVMVSARSPAAQRKVLLLGKQRSRLGHGEFHGELAFLADCSAAPPPN
jgi:hypothetical protein